MLEGAAQQLRELGFAGPETYSAGTDFHVAFRRGPVEVSVFSEDMGTNFPNATVRWPDGSWTYVVGGGAHPTYGGEYPAHEELWAASGWWKRRAVRKRLGCALEEEFVSRAIRLIHAAARVVQEADRAAGAV